MKKINLCHYCDEGEQFIAIVERSIFVQGGRVYHGKTVTQNAPTSLINLWKRAKESLFEKGEDGQFLHHSVTLVRGKHRWVFTRKE